MGNSRAKILDERTPTLGSNRQFLDPYWTQSLAGGYSGRPWPWLQSWDRSKRCCKWKLSANCPLHRRMASSSLKLCPSRASQCPTWLCSGKVNILLKRKRRLRVIILFAQGHPTWRWKKDVNPGKLIPELLFWGKFLKIPLLKDFSEPLIS